MPVHRCGRIAIPVHMCRRGSWATDASKRNDDRHHEDGAAYSEGPRRVTNAKRGLVVARRLPRCAGRLPGVCRYLPRLPLAKFVFVVVVSVRAAERDARRDRARRGAVLTGIPVCGFASAPYKLGYFRTMYGRSGRDSARPPFATTWSDEDEPRIIFDLLFTPDRFPH